MKYIELIEKHTEELVDIIKKIKRLPRMKEMRFSDGVDMYRFYLSLINMDVDKKFVNKKFSNEELIIIKKSLESIKETLELVSYDDKELSKVIKLKEKRKEEFLNTTTNVKNLISINYKNFDNFIVEITSEVIKKIDEIKYLPNCDEIELSNGMDLRRYVNVLISTYNKEKSSFTKEKNDKFILMQNAINEIYNVFKKYNISYIEELSISDKAKELIAVLLIKSIIPKDEYFADGINKYKFFNTLRRKYSQIISKKELTDEETKIIEMWNEISWVLMFIKYRKYYNTYEDSCLSFSENAKLKKWLLVQIVSYYDIDKTPVQLAHESLLSKVDIAWMETNTYLLERGNIKKALRF